MVVEAEIDIPHVLRVLVVPPALVVRRREERRHVRRPCVPHRDRAPNRIPIGAVQIHALGCGG